MWDWIWYMLVFLGLLLGIWSLLRATLRTLLPVAGQTQSQRTVLLVPIIIIIVVVGLRPTLATDITAPPAYRLLTEVRLGIDRDLRQFGSPGQPGEETPPFPATPDKGEEAAWLPMWTRHVQVPVQFIE